MKLGQKSSFRNSMKAGSNNSKKRPYGLLLLLAMGAAILSVVVLHKLRERRIFGILLEDQDRELISLQLLLQKEREHGKELKRKLEDMKAKAISWKTKMLDLTNKLTEAEATAAYLKEKQREMEIALEKKENQVNGLTNKEVESIKEKLLVAELLRQKEAEVEEMKHHFADLKQLQKETAEDNIMTTENVTNNEKVDTSSKDGQFDSSTNPSEGRTSVEEAQVDSSIQLAGTQDVKAPQEGQWVSFKTNKDDEGLKQENQSDVRQHGVDFSSHQQENQNPGAFEVSYDNEQVEKNQESTPKDRTNSQEVENSQHGNEDQHQKLEVSHGIKSNKIDQGSTPEDPNNFQRVENSQDGNEGQYQKLQASQENEDRLKNQESTQEDSTNSQKLENSQYGNEGQNQKLEISQDNENMKKNQESTSEDPNNSQKVDNSQYRYEGQYEKLEVSQYTENKEKKQESTPEGPNQKVENSQNGNEGQNQKLEVSQDNEDMEKNIESTPEDPNSSQKVDNSQYKNEGQYEKLEISQDNENKEKKQESTAEYPNQKVENSQYGNGQNLEVAQDNENKEKNRESVPKNPNNSQKEENSQYRNEGHYQKLEVQESTTEDSNQKVELSRYGNEGQYHHVDKLESSEDRENKLDRGEKDQESISEAPKHEETVELYQEINKEDGGEKSQERIQEIPKDKEKDESSQQGNMDQLVTSETTGTRKWEDGTVITDGQSNRTKSKRRRRKTRKGRMFVNQNNGHLENSENNNSESKRDQNADINTVEPNKMEAISGQPEVPERTVAEYFAVENGDGNKNAPESKEVLTPSDSSKSEMMVNSHNSEVPIRNMENVVHSEVRDDSGGRDGTGDENEVENNDNEASTTVTKLEMPEGSQNNVIMSTRNQSNVSDLTQDRNKNVGTDAQSQKMADSVSNASPQLHDGGNVSEGAHLAQEKEVKSTEIQLEMNKEAQVDENIKADQKTGNIADLPKDAKMERTETSNTEANPEQTQASSTAGEYQSQSSLGTTDKVNTSSDEDSKTKDAELPNNAENKHDDRVGEF